MSATAVKLLALPILSLITYGPVVSDGSDLGGSRRFQGKNVSYLKRWKFLLLMIISPLPFFLGPGEPFAADDYASSLRSRAKQQPQ